VRVLRVAAAEGLRVAEATLTAPLFGFDPLLRVVGPAAVVFRVVGCVFADSALLATSVCIVAASRAAR
jgi:hypothetical protein